MERFTKVPAKITARGLETQEIDQKRERLVDEHRQRTSDTKFYIKDNMSKLRQTEMEFKLNEMATNAQKEKKLHFQTKYQTKVPAYLKKFRQEEEEERQKTLAEIEMNKRPHGTRVVTADEKNRVLGELYGQKAYLENGIKNMSVTLYTNRAQNQYRGYAQNLDSIDKTLNVFERPKVFVAP